MPVPVDQRAATMNQAKWDTSDFSGMTEMDGAAAVLRVRIAEILKCGVLELGCVWVHDPHIPVTYCVLVNKFS